MLPNGRGILFTRLRGTDTEIVVLSLETGEARTLFDGRLARYANSGHVVYMAADGSLFAAPFVPDRLEPTGAGQPLLEETRVPGLSNGYFALSETGVLGYRPGVPTREIIPAWVDRDGASEVLDLDIRGSYEAPAISPDGRRIALEYVPEVGIRQIWIYEMDQGTFAPLTFEGTSRRPFWSPDGSEVGFTSARGGEYAAYARSPDFGGEARLLRAAEDAPIQEALWTPDGQWLVYRRGTIGVGGLYYARPHPDSASVLILEAEEFVAFAPAISPDGRWLAYTSSESGRREIYVRPFPGPGGRIQLSREGGQGPVWGRDGGTLFYRASTGFWVVATVRSDPDPVVESREQFASWQGFANPTSTQQFDIAPDGQRVLALQIRESEVGEVRDIIVQNFFEDLNRLVPAN